MKIICYLGIALKDTKEKEGIDEIGVAVYWWFLKLDPWGSITSPIIILRILEFFNKLMPKIEKLAEALKMKEIESNLIGKVFPRCAG